MNLVNDVISGEEGELVFKERLEFKSKVKKNHCRIKYTKISQKDKNNHEKTFSVKLAKNIDERNVKLHGN